MEYTCNYYIIFYEQVEKNVFDPVNCRLPNYHHIRQLPFRDHEIYQLSSPENDRTHSSMFSQEVMSPGSSLPSPSFPQEECGQKNSSQLQVNLQEEEDNVGLPCIVLV